MDTTPTRNKAFGWIIVVVGMIWALVVLISDQKKGTDISSTLGGVTVPILVSLVGLYLAGIIKNAK
jgi:hypothetical protein